MPANYNGGKPAVSWVHSKDAQPPVMDALRFLSLRPAWRQYLKLTGIKAGLLLMPLLMACPPVPAAIVEFDSAGFTRQIEATSAQRLELDWSSIARLYGQVDGRLLWHTGERLNARGRQLLTWLEASRTEGLNPADYHVAHLQRLGEGEVPGYLALRELLLSDGYLRLAADLRRGSLAVRELDPLVVPEAEAFDPVATLVDALEQERLSDMLVGLGPANRAYDRLRLALARYRAIESAGGWQRLTLDHPLRPGDRDPQIARLRDRLAREATQPVGQGDTPGFFDAGLQAELQRFQQRHGLRADGVVGPETLKALNVPVADRIAQLRINLERWRWMPHEMAAEHLLVNTAGFDIAFHSRERVIYSGRTVNGSEERPTPSMISRITHLVANPPWTVPRRIAVEDMLPRQQADPGYLSSKRIRPYRRAGQGWEAFDPETIDWSPYHRDNFPFVLKQDAGAGNSLGRVKFHMPNSQAIFLHDTPAVGLFRRPVRAFSSGCVRVEAADRLAGLLTDRADPWEAERFDLALTAGETRITPLREPLTVYLTYFTSWVDETGAVHFRPDIYQRDADLMMAMAGAGQPSTAHRSAAPTSSSL